MTAGDQEVALSLGAVSGTEAPQRLGLVPTLRQKAARAYADHVVRSSLLTISATVVTSLLGFAYWNVAARVAPASAVGYAAAMMSAATAASLLTAQGITSLVVERLPAFEPTGEWAAFLSRWIWVAAGLSAAAAVFIGLAFVGGGAGGLSPSWSVPLLAVCAACLTVLGVLDRAFMSARRADLGLLVATVLGAAKLASLGALLLAASDVAVMLGGWTVALVAISAIGVFVVAPRVGQGRLGVPKSVRTSREEIVHVLGHHVTSVGGIMTPYVLPMIVVTRLDAASNAYFYASWMVGSVFFIVSPAVAGSLFAEGARAAATLGDRTRRAVRLLALLLPLPILAGIFLGRFVLMIFGRHYADQGYALLVVLAVSALPDAFTNVAVAVLRIRGELRRSSALNLAMGVITLAGAWVFLPSHGLVAAGVAWLVAQVLGSLAVVPLMVRTLHRPRGRRSRER